MPWHAALYSRRRYVLLLLLGIALMALTIYIVMSRATRQPITRSTDTSSAVQHAGPTPGHSTVPATPPSIAPTPGSSSSPGATPGTSAPPVASPATVARTLHFSVNIGSNKTAAYALGFNLIDISGSTSNPAGTKSTIDALPSGIKALVWVGNLDNGTSSCPAPGFTTAQFQSLVNTLSGDSKVYGYFLADEPHNNVCPSAPTDIQARADYIRAHAPGQISFIVVLDGSNQCGASLGCEYNAFRPAVTHVDYIGLDPYPCHYASDGVTPVPCDNSAITSKVTTAIQNGIPTSSIVPVFQTFGQSGRSDGKSVYYRLPTASELSSMLTTWKSLVPSPAFDYAYTYGVQCSSSCPAPQAIENTPSIQAVIQAHNYQ